MTIREWVMESFLEDAKAFAAKVYSTVNAVMSDDVMPMGYVRMLDFQNGTPSARARQWLVIEEILELHARGAKLRKFKWGMRFEFPREADRVSLVLLGKDDIEVEIHVVRDNDG